MLAIYKITYAPQLIQIRLQKRRKLKLVQTIPLTSLQQQEENSSKHEHNRLVTKQNKQQKLKHLLKVTKTTQAITTKAVAFSV